MFSNSIPHKPFQNLTICLTLRFLSQGEPVFTVPHFVYQNVDSKKRSAPSSHELRWLIILSIQTHVTEGDLRAKVSYFHLTLKPSAPVPRHFIGFVRL